MERKNKVSLVCAKLVVFILQKGGKDKINHNLEINLLISFG